MQSFWEKHLFQKSFMRKMLFLLLLLPLFSIAQRYEWDYAYNKSIPGGLGERIHLPKRDYNFDFKWDDTLLQSFASKREGIFVVTNDAIYHKLFWRYIYTKDSLAKYRLPVMNFYDSLSYRSIQAYLIDSLPVIDFAKKELVMYTACAQCLAFCDHGKDSENDRSCHRNACMYRETWFVREKKKF